MSQENATSKQPLIRYVNRQQMSWRAVDVEQLTACPQDRCSGPVQPELARCLHAVANTPAGRMEFVRSYDSIRFGLPTNRGGWTSAFHGAAGYPN